MIKSVLLQNFQSHKKTELIFSPGVNCIIGPSNNGKTSILRALYWTIYNRPSGLAFVSHWNRDKNGKPVKSTYVKIENDSGIIERRKGKVKKDDDLVEFNGYVINDEKYLEAIGQDVPEEVQNLFNLDSVNIQKQMDAPFLLSESAGEVARFFNSTIRLDLIDRILSRAEHDRRETNREKIALETSLQDIDKNIETFTWIEEAEILANKISKIEKRIENTQSKKSRLEYIEEEYQESKAAIENCEVILSAAFLVKKILLAQESLEEKESSFSNLQAWLTDHKNQEIIIQEAADFSIAEKLVIKIDAFRVATFEKVKRQESLVALTDEYKIKYMGKESNAIKIIELEKSLPKNCPLCGAKI